MSTLARGGGADRHTDALAGLSYPERRTVLLIHAGLISSGCDGATTWLVHEYLEDSGVIPQLNALRLHCASTFFHSLGTMKFTVRIAKKMGVDTSEHAILCVGALLHDIGKLAMPTSLLHSSGALRKADLEKIRTHPEIGYDSVSDTRIIGWNAVLDIIRHHHEYLDGTGYPLGLKAPQISWRTRCITVCNVFCSLTEVRSYRPAVSQGDALAILSEMARAGQIDGEILDALRSDIN